MRIWNLVLMTALFILSNSANATLVSRLGGFAYYDTEANLTWLADANFAKTTGYDDDGKMSWQDAMTWAAQLDIDGETGWRLPTVNDIGNDGVTLPSGNYYDGVDGGYNFDTSNGEMAFMHYDTLGNTSRFEKDGAWKECGPAGDLYNCLNNSGPFVNIQSTADVSSAIFWTDTAYATNPANYAWIFDFSSGYQGSSPSASYYHRSAWAVKSGDVPVDIINPPYIPSVPVPAAVWLFGSGLIGLAGVARRKKA